MEYLNVREESLKNKVARNFFGKFDCTEIIKDIDFAVKSPTPTLPKGEGVSSPPSGESEGAYLLWAEAKKKLSNIYESIAQLVLTIGKARTFNEILPPPFLGCFDPEKIAFVPYSDVQDIFYQNDFNWKVAPSDYNTKEFQLILQKVKESIDNKSFLFYFEKDEDELRQFIRENFIVGKTETSKIRIDKNNFINVYQRWLNAVKPTICVDWSIAKKNNILDCDFYLADLLSSNHKTIQEKLNVLLNTDYYKYNKREDILGTMFHDAYFSDNQKAYTQFWTKYERPPREDYQHYIMERRPLLVPQDVREVKGSFFTPPQWVELSQEYLAKTFGENWQDEYYIWDCAAGTGNLLAGLVNKYHIFASTLDKQDVDVMHQRIVNGANLLESHVFQFDFLNDDFSKLPQSLQDIINDPKRRKKLIIYINPPYAEVSGIKHGKKGVNLSKIHKKYTSILGTAGRELFTQFFIRVCKEIPEAKLASFGKMKYISGSAFESFRNHFLAEYKKGFICRSNTFDNVPGKFPIGFLIWDLERKKKIGKTTCDVFDNDRNQPIIKTFYAYKNSNYINEWISAYNKKQTGEYLGFLAGTNGNAIQNNRIVYIINKREQMPNPRGICITLKNLIPSCVYFAVRKVIKPTWLNDRDQFLFPNKKWEKDLEFQNDCLAYTIFNNNISTKHGVNHWIPFMETEIDAKDAFASHTLIRFISGKEIQNSYVDLFDNEKIIKREFSETAKKVFDAGRELWKYYHQQPNINVNASLYDIREYFQGRNEKGKMNNQSDNPTYNELIENLRDALKLLAQKIEPKVYEYGFLME